MSTTCPSPRSTATRPRKAAPILASSEARAISSRRRRFADYADLDRRLRSGDVKATIEIPPGFGRDIKRGRPDFGRSVDRWRDAVSRRDHPRLPAGRPSAIPDRPGDRHHERLASRRRDDRDPLSLQPGLQERLRHGAGDHGDAAGADPRHPDGAGDRAGKGARLDHEFLRYPGDQASSFSSASKFPTSPWRWSTSWSCS